MLSGEYAHSLDDKGRITIPVKFRKELGNSFMITNGLDGCLFIFPDKEWKIFETQLRTQGVLSNKDVRTLTRYFVGGGVSSILDKTGRTIIPSSLRDNAGLDKEIVLVGVLNRIEIWDKDKWNNQTKNIRDNADEIANHLDELGINL